uniref:Nudix hydrolase domain-containing protein n=1 Tax=Lygus hesperus TaxID=30085 RepID=A0A0K8T3I1_LYGHE
MVNLGCLFPKPQFLLHGFSALIVSTLRHSIEPLQVMELHQKCRNTTYGSDGKISRVPVPDNLVKWEQVWKDYSPPYYTAPGVIGKPWADKEIGEDGFCPKWNSLDQENKVDRRSLMGEYKIVDGYPLNPIGRTGLRGRGILGKWGPNHAADPVVTRWKRNASNDVIKHENSAKPILQFVSIRRKDNRQWAFPGGMVDPGEVVSQTLKREFLEETMNSLEMTPELKSRVESHIQEFFSGGDDVYRGYVDDPRNTDNAWMETVAKNFHDEDGSFVGTLSLNAGDDAVGVSWIDVSSQLHLYASHSMMPKSVAEKLNAHW